ncbi:hypothetical protein F183_A11850 [Bryobacterales bacterium F-183]|nr:hypothetical protein F183_A11850 [Bryobacterales bacterium F-183]
MRGRYCILRPLPRRDSGGQTGYAMRMFIGKLIPAALLSAVVSLAQSTERISGAAAVAVPEPGTNLLIGGALLGLAVAFRRRAKS